MDRETSDHIIQIKESQARSEADMYAIKRELLGNGQPGIKQRVEQLEADRSKFYGMVAGMTFLGGIFQWIIHTLMKGGK
jgi:hypothetical protein